MAVFGRDSGEASLNTPPVEKVLAFREQGLSNNQIVEALQRAGHSTDNIFTAMNQADLQSAGAIDNAVPLDEAEPLPPISNDELGQPPGYEQQQAPADSEYEQYAEETTDESADVRFEELAEQIVEEKWKILAHESEKVLEWKQQTDRRLERIEQRFADVRVELQSLHKALFERMDSYDKNVGKVGVNLKAMDAVFKKTLPKLTENINDLSELTDSLRKSGRK